MTTVCLHVKPTAYDPGIGLMSVTLLSPRWTGNRLRLRRPSTLGLSHGDVVGWTDFYGGGPCQVHVARATNGRDSGYLVWGGTLGLRVVPEHVEEVDRQLGDVLESRSVLWIADLDVLPLEVRQAVQTCAESAPPAAGTEALRVAPELVVG